MPRISYIDSFDGSFGEARGAAHRLNVSSRSDTRAYYISRDSGRAFTLVFDHQSAAAGEYSAYLRNDDSERTLVVSSIQLNSVEASRIKLHFVSGTGSGTTITPARLNRNGSKNATATALVGPVTGLTSEDVAVFAFVEATGHDEFRLEDTVRLGEGDAIAIEYDEGTTGDFFGTLFFFYEIDSGS
jgi:hypothetical protein